MSVVIRERERDRERDYDDRTSTFRRENGGYTTVKRYRVPAEEERVDTRRTVIYSPDRDRERERDRFSERDRGEDRSFEETRIIRRERTPEPEPERRVERDIRIERIEREREPEPRRFAEYRYEHVDRLPPRREPYELERYSRSTEYFPRPDPPQPIIIRQEPQQIIIQEAPRAPIVVPAPQKEETDFQLIQRSEVVDNDHRSVISKATTKREKEPQRDEEYYYERRTREVQGGDRDDDFYEERHRRREVSPGESVSQVGRRRGRDRDYSSDDSMVYVRRETRDTYERDESPDHRRHLAEGAIAGIGAAELLRHHRSRQGEEMSGTGSRLAKDIGAAGLGAVAAQGISRARSHHREKSRRRRSRSRSRSSSYDTYREGRRRERRKKSKSRSRSRSRVKQLAGIGLGAAAVAAAVGYANRKNKANKQQEDRRSRSRTRRHSVGAEIPENDPRNPAHRNKKIAQAGLAGAAVAGLVERARSKSRGPDKKGRERSKSRIRTGLPIAAAGLGTAAIAGLYERSQANKNEKQDEQQAKAVRKERKEARREARSRSRDLAHEGSRDVGAGDSGLIEYGDQPVYSSGGQDYYNRPASQQGFYSPDAVVPAAAAAGAAYGVQNNREQRRRGSSSSGSDSKSKRRHRRKKSNSRSRSRGRDIAAAGLAAGAGAVAATEYEKRKQRKHEKRERRRQEELREQAAFDESYPPQAQQQPFSPISPPPNQQSAAETGFAPGTYYPNTNQFAPPPGQGFSPQPAAYPQEYPPPPGAQPHQAQLSPEYGYQQQTGYTPPVPGNPYDPPGADPYGQQQPGGRTRRADENVSAAPVSNTPSTAAKRYVPEEGINTPRAPSPPPLQHTQHRSSSQPPPGNKSVQFNLDPASPIPPDSPAQIRKRRQRAGSTNARSPYLDPAANQQPSDTNASDATLVNSDRPPRHHRHRRSRSQGGDKPRTRSRSPTESDATVDLPDRFDQYGRKKPEKGDDPLADKIEEFFGGKGKGGKWLNKLMGEDSDEGDRDGQTDVGGREYRDREREKRRRRRSGRG
ncbi:MAG: hypothetical protein Q9195_008112 [Heterodermia aff. obscurata]